MSNDRTLPVTPAERACATVLRAFITWNLDGTREAMTLEYGAMLKLGDFLSAQGLTIEDVGDPTDAGAALLARVEAAERTPETVLRAMLVSYGAAAIELRTELWRSPAWPPLFARQLDVLDHAITTLHNAIGAHLAASPRADESLMSLGRLVRTDYAARLAGTTPIAAPPAKEPR